jgi:hypothetical protein
MAPAIKILGIAAALSWSMAASSWAGSYDAPVLAPPSNLGRSPSPTESAEPAAACDGAAAPLDLLFAPPELPTVVGSLVDTEVLAETLPAEEPLLPSVTSATIAAEAPCLAAACTPVSGYMSCCDPLRCHSFWFAAVDAGFLGITGRTGGRASVRFEDAMLPGTEFQASGGTGLENFVVAPRVALGYQINPRWGIVGRYWSVNDHDQNLPAVPPEASTLDSFSIAESVDARLDAADLELIRSFAPGRWKLDASAGVRYANLEESAAISAGADFAGPNFARAYLLNRTRFSGTGLTGALAARRPLGVGGASLFASGRSSFLWGSASSRAQLESLLSTPNGSPAAELIIDRAASSPFAWIGEVQLGLQWDLPLERLPANAFLRTAVEYQRWTVDASMQSEINATFTDSTISTSQSVNAGHGSVDLYGLSLAMGFTW